MIITDAMGMGGATQFYSGGEAAVRALAAGCDILLGVRDPDECVVAIRAELEKSGGEARLNWDRIDESVLRILTLKEHYGLL